MVNNEIVQKLWNLCDVLRDDGINYSDYMTELVLLLFIKMERENTKAGVLKKHKLPDGYRWNDLNDKSGVEMLTYYKKMLHDLSKSDDQLISEIYNGAETSIREYYHLEQLVKSIDSIEWFNIQKDGLGDLYEGLLEKNVSESKSGAGQYFTPRPLIDSIINCVKPKLGETIQDPAAGTAGFLIAADRAIKKEIENPNKRTFEQKKNKGKCSFLGMELVPGTRRLAQMNCLLHGMEEDDQGVVHLDNTLGEAGKSLKPSDVILTNPPFGTAKGGGGPTRDDLTYTTSNKQLAFLQHIYLNLKHGGRAAVALPDNVLFEAGVGTDIRKDLMNKCNLHTILRLPTGIFYAAGVKTNVLFFTKGADKNPHQVENCTQNVWVYDLRTNMPSFGKRTPFSGKYLNSFETVFGNDPYDQSKRKEGEWSFTEEGTEETIENSRWRIFDRDYIRTEKGDSLDISWIKDKDSIDAADMPSPAVLAGEAMGELAKALRDMDGLMRELGSKNEADASLKLVKEALGFGGMSD